MKRVLWRYFVNYEKEENWLNGLAAKGLAMTDFFFGRYIFSDSEPGEYVYRIELLSNHIGHPESQKYIAFMEENGVELVATWIRWVYFRRKAKDGAFDIYSDIDSRIAHYRRILLLFLPLLALDVANGVNLTLLFVSQLLDTVPMFEGGLLFVAVLSFGVGAALAVLCGSLFKKVKRLGREKLLRE
ncbi:MAG TPA: hypothetical protein DEB31_02295 [Clostridiales bacterium]|nr:hypothetical protein [Clostridiales bacterium]